jgi:hypothetical protein
MREWLRRGISALQRFVPLPAAARARLWLVFLALVVVKLIIIAGLNNHLYEIHWRTLGLDPSWVDSAAFVVFVGLGLLSLLRLGQHCRAAGFKAVRAANAVVVGLGLAVIFFTFHTGEKNYLYPIFAHVLRWSSLGPYLTLDLFFRPPYLSVWLFGYGAAYYVLLRTGRELWTTHLTTLSAGAYAIICLSELGSYRNELLLVDCLGLVWLAQGRGWRTDFSLRWLLIPATWTLFFALMILRLVFPILEPLSVTYLLLVLGCSVILFGLATLAAHRYGFLTPWSNLLPFYFVGFLLLANTHYPLAGNYDNLVCLSLEFPRYFVGELVVLTVLAVGAGLWHRWLPKAGFWWLDVLNLTLILVALIDLRLSQIMGVRLQWEVLDFASSPKMMWRMAQPYLPGLLAGLVGAVVIYVILLRVLVAWLSTTRGSSVHGSNRKPLASSSSSNERAGGSESIAPRARVNHGFRYLAACFVALALLGLALANEDKGLGQAMVNLASPLWARATHRTLAPDQLLASASALGLGDFPEPRPAANPPVTRDLNVVLVFLESSFNRHLSLFGSPEETQPLLSKYKDRMELYPNFFSDFAGSIQARFATFTSLYPVRDFNAFTLHRVRVKSIFEILHEHGYASSLFYSSYFDYTGFGDFLQQRGIDEMYDADTMPGQRGTERISWGLREEETLGAMRRQIQKYAQSQQKFFLTYVPAAPHYPYDCVPAAFKKFPMKDPGDFTPMYLNELLYIDWVLASLVDQLKDSGLLDHTLVIITNDHGEKTGADGETIGHGWVLTPQLANTPLIIMDPARPGYRLNYTIGSQVDLLPTLLDRLGLPLPPGELYQGCSLETTNRPDRCIYLNTYQQFGVIIRDRLLIGDRQTDQPGALASAMAAYTISNQGSRTIFTEDRTSPVSVSIRRFDEFQENLLHDYSRYSSALAKIKPPTQTARR